MITVKKVFFYLLVIIFSLFVFIIHIKTDIITKTNYSFPFSKATDKTLKYQNYTIVPVNGKWGVEKINGYETIVGIGIGKYPQIAVINHNLRTNYQFSCQARGFNNYISFFHRVKDLNHFYQNSFRYWSQNITLKKAGDFGRRVIYESPGFNFDRTREWHDIKIVVMNDLISVFIDNMNQAKLIYEDKTNPYQGGYFSLAVFGNRKTMYRDIKIIDNPDYTLLDIIPERFTVRTGQQLSIKCNLFSSKKKSNVRVLLKIMQLDTPKNILSANFIKSVNGSSSFPYNFTPKKDGEYKITALIKSPYKIITNKTIFAYSNNQQKIPDKKDRQLKFIDAVDLTNPNSSLRIRDNKRGRIIKAPFGNYLESGDQKDFDYIAVNFHISNPEKIHYLEIDYPDDADRQMSLSIHTCNEHFANDLGGIPTGVGIPISKSMKTYGEYFVPRHWPAKPGNNCVVLLQNWWNGHRAAASKVRLYEVKNKLLPLDVKNKAKSPRKLGVYCEDPNGFRYNLNMVNYGGASPEVQWNHAFKYLGELMNYTGQNLFHFPVYWYGGTQYGSKIISPRKPYQTYNNLLKAWLIAAEKYHYKLLFNITPAGQSAFPTEIAKDIGKAVSKGWLQMSGKTNKPVQCSGNQAIKAYQVPELAFLGKNTIQCLANPLHPKFEKLWWDLINETIIDNALSPSLEGLSIRLSSQYASLLCFKNIESGYGDYTTSLYEKDRNIKIPVKENDPERFSKRFRWLVAHRKSDWINWRCEQLTPRLIKTMDLIKNKNPELKLYLDLYNLPELNEAQYIKKYKECGIDIAKLMDIQNIILLKRISPNYDRMCLINGNKGCKRIRSLFENHSQDRFAKGAFFYSKYFESHQNKTKKERDIQFNWSRIGHGAGGIQDTGRRFLRGYVRELARLDAKLLMFGGWGLEFLGHCRELREFARAYMTLEEVDYKLIPTKNPALTLREYKTGTKHYFYITNTQAKPAKIMIKIAPSLPIRELTNNISLLSDKNGIVSMSLKPYSVRSFLMTDMNQKSDTITVVQDSKQ